jgi:predicted nuclease of predicted toxin-antitoxin system
MRWLLDQGLPRSAAAILNEAQEDAIHVGDVGMGDAPDPLILQHALSENRIIVTLDADFHALLAKSGSSKPSVIRIREEGLKGHQLAALLLRIAGQFETELHRGCVMTFLQGKIRYRALPL